jgi:hypothetical protein
METCPPGFRRPTAGNTPASGAATNEFRYSLFTKGGTILDGNGENGENSVWGYYADGYFDRRELATQRASADNTVPYGAVATSTGSADADNNWNVAYIGRLFYNDTDERHASIFFPGAGQRHHDGFLNFAGYGYYLSSNGHNQLFSGTSNGSSYSYYSSYMMGFTGTAPYHGSVHASRNDYSRASAVSLRCVACPSETGSASVRVTWDGTYSTTDVKNNGRFLLNATLSGLSAVGNNPYHWEYLYNNVWRDFTGALVYTATGESRFAPTNNGRYRFRVTIKVEDCGGQQTTVTAETSNWNYTYSPYPGGVATEM